VILAPKNKQARFDKPTFHVSPVTGQLSELIAEGTRGSSFLVIFANKIIALITPAS